MFLFFYKIQGIEKMKALNCMVSGISESISRFRTKRNIFNNSTWKLRKYEVWPANLVLPYIS